MNSPWTVKITSSQIALLSCLLTQQENPMQFENDKTEEKEKQLTILARTHLQLPLRQWGASNIYLLVLSSWKVNIAENPIAVMGL